jgi:hypothetical protein
MRDEKDRRAVQDWLFKTGFFDSLKENIQKPQALVGPCI